MARDFGLLSDPTLFPIRVHHYLIGEVPSLQAASQITQQLERSLQDSSLDASQLKPTLVHGMPAAKMGDRLLFTLDQTLTNDWNHNAELTAIAWVNNLRIALNQPPLSLVSAQATMHDLQATGDAIAGLASWYGPYFDGRQTATGELFNQNDLTAAHPSLPFNTYLKVTNLNNGKSVIVRINDRGPYYENRTLDLSHEAAESLDSENTGVVPVEAVIMQPIANAHSSNSIVSRYPN
jgi:rare lipoprotein A